MRPASGRIPVHLMPCPLTERSRYPTAAVPRKPLAIPHVGSSWRCRILPGFRPFALSCGLRFVPLFRQTELLMKITDALVAEHAIFLGIFDEIERLLPSLATPAEVRTMAAMIERLLESHAAHESNLAYIALDHVLAHNGELDRMHHEHAEVDSRLKKVQQSATCAEARSLLKASIAAAREHFRLEQNDVFPLLEKSLELETLQQLGRTWLSEKARMVTARNTSSTVLQPEQ